jgi:hypothetical protein
MARILGAAVDEGTVEQIVADHPAPGLMSLLDVAGELHALTGMGTEVWEVTLGELAWLDYPHIIHVQTSGCTECQQGGHVVAVERLAGEWAIIETVEGTQLISADRVRDAYGGHAVLAAQPGERLARAPRIALDSYVSDMGTVTAGTERHCRLTVRNVGAEVARIRRVEAGGDVGCLRAPTELEPGEAGDIELSVCPRHRLDRKSETRTYFVHILSNDRIRPRTSAAVRCAIDEPVVLTSNVVYFPRVRAGEPGRRRVNVECRPPVELLEALSSHPSVAAEVTETGREISATHYAIDVEVKSGSLELGVVQLPISLRLRGVESEGAEIIARVRVYSD